MSEPLYPPKTKQLATRIANRVDAGLCGMDPGTIILVICAVLNVAINCWQASHDVNPEQAQAELARRCQTQRDRRIWEWKLARAIGDRQNVQPYQAHLIAKAMIDEALEESNRDEVVGLMRGEG